jgi:hypothetical protein
MGLSLLYLAILGIFPYQRKEIKPIIHVVTSFLKKTAISSIENISKK